MLTAKTIPLPKFILIVVTAMIALTFSGCASVAKQTTNVFPDPKPGKGLVYFYREGKFMGWGISYNIKYKNEVIGALANGTYFFYEVEPGTHTFSANTESTVSRTLTIEAGKTYYIAGSVEMGAFVGRPALSIVSEAEGKSVLPGLKYAIKSAN